MKRRLAIAIPAGVFILLVAVGVIRSVRRGAREEAPDIGVAVVVQNLERASIEEILRYPGTLIPAQTVTAVSKVPGRVEKIHVAEGARVVPGQLLVTVDAESVSLQSDQAHAVWQAAEAQLRKAERGVRDEELENTRALVEQASEDVEIANRNYERSKRLYDAGTISRARFEEAESAYRGATTSLENTQRSLKMMESGASTEDIDAARSQAEALKAQYDLAMLQQGDASVTATFHGTAARILVDPGNTVGVGTALLALVSEHPIHAQIAIPEKYYGRFVGAKNTMQVRVYPSAYGSSEAFLGTVKTVAPLIDAESRTFVIEAAVPNLDGRLRPGMYVNTEIIVAVRPNVHTLPETAVVSRDDEQVVFVIETGNSGHAMMRTVDTGLRSGGVVEIVTGLEADARVIVAGNAFLENGQRVRVVEAQ